MLISKSVSYSLLSSLLFLGGCTSLSDFQKMGANERADFVCSKDKKVVSSRGAVADYDIIIADINKALFQGYRLHTSCHNETVVKPDKTTCQSTSYGYGVQTNCKESSTEETKKVCNETPVSIDSKLEKEKLSHYSELRSGAFSFSNSTYQECHNRIEILTAEQAYRVYRPSYGT
jgi:hypothetical protein